MISRFRIPRKYKLRSGINRGLYKRIFAFIVIFPIVSYLFKYLVLLYLGYTANLPKFDISIKLLALLFLTYCMVSFIVTRILIQAHYHKGVDKSFRIGFLFYAFLTLVANLVGNSYLQILFPLEFIIILSLAYKNLLMLLVSILIGTILGSKGMAIWALIYFYLAFGLSFKRGLMLACSFPIVVLLYISGRVARFSARTTNGFELNYFLSELKRDLFDKENYDEILISFANRLNQYDGVDFAMRAAEQIRVSVFDIGFLFNRLAASIIPGMRGEQSFGIYIGRLMNPEKNFEYGFAGAMGILGQFVIIDPFEIFVYILYLVVTFGIGGLILTRYLSNQAILILLSLQLTQILMSGNLDIILVNLARLIFAVIFFSILNKFLMSFRSKPAGHNIVMNYPHYRKPH